MTLFDRFIKAHTRIASAGSVVRQRSVEAERAERRTSEREIAVRLEAVVSQLESSADELEKALA